MLRRVCFVTLLAAIAAAAQQPPITLTVEETTEGRIVRCENTSDRAIAAFVIRIDYKDQSGKVALSEARTAMTKDLGLDKGRPAYQPGEQWVDRFPKPSGLGQGEPALDLVIYADGTHWGPNKSGRLQYILGFRDGVKISLAQ